MKHFKNWNELKNHDVKVKFKQMNSKDEDNVKEFQMLIFFDDDTDPIYKTRKGAFEFKEITYFKFKLNKWYLPQCYKTTYVRLVWKDEKKYQKYISFTKKFRIYSKIQETVLTELDKFAEKVEGKEGFIKI